MKEFTHTIKDELGIHARPAGLLVKTAVPFFSDIKIKKGEKTADAKKLFSLMGLGAKFHDALSFTIEGADEERAFEVMKSFCEENL